MKRHTYKRQIPPSQYPVYKYTLANVNLRENKSTSSRSLAVIPANTKVQIVDSYEDWLEANYNGQFGYIYNAYISKTKYTWREAFLHSFPTAESNPITLMPAQSEVEVLSVTGDWSQVVYNDQVGYVFNDFLTDDGNPPNAYNYEFFYTDMLRFVNENQIKSPTVNLITTDLVNKLTYVFVKGNNGLWNLLYTWSCTVGKPTTPTIVGTFYISGRKPYFGSDSYRVKYATRILGSYYYHTILFNADGTEIIDPRLGQALSHGCIRLAVENAQWIYDNVLDVTAVIIN